MYLLLDAEYRIMQVLDVVNYVDDKWIRLEGNGLFQADFASDIVEVAEIGQGDYYYNGQFQLLPYQELDVNTELADAYEAIANLYEMNLSLQARLEALENAV